ncbi:MAG: hypothetical protein ACK5MH_06040 [Bacteroidales bacterium]
MERLERLNETYLKIEDELEKGVYDVERDVLDLNQEVNDSIESSSGDELQKLKELYKKINKIMEENNFYEEEDEEVVLDMMFPNRDDDDFDYDDMSYDSVFGDD